MSTAATLSLREAIRGTDWPGMRRGVPEYAYRSLAAGRANRYLARDRQGKPLRPDLVNDLSDGQDALKRGFSAIAIQARHPLQALRLSKEAGIRAILNHRVRPIRPPVITPFWSILTPRRWWFMTPFGAARRLSHAELMELWLPQVPNSEIAEAY